MRSALAATFVVAGLVAGCAGVDAPTLTEVAPAAARRGDAVVLHGDGFCVPDCEASPVGAVDFGLDPQIRAVAVTWDATAIEVVVPQSVAIGSTDVVVTVNDRSSNAVGFEVLP